MSVRTVAAVPKTPTEPMAAADFARAAGVSRETLAKFETYHAQLSRWQRAMNLISPASSGDIWRRHFLDSVQFLAPLEGLDQSAGAIADIGSGAGFPGLVLALLGVNEIHLIESNKKKAVFLRQMAEELEVNAVIHKIRAEEYGAKYPHRAAAVVARAVAPLPDLLALARPLLLPDGTALLAKGRAWQDEIAAARQTWAFQVTAKVSTTDPASRLLIVSKLNKMSQNNRLTRISK